MNKAKKIAITGVFSAMVFVLTAFVKIPVTCGYIHLGDTLIYLCAGFVAGPWAMLAGVIGAVLADIIGGYIMYAPATAVIKALTVIPFIIAYRKGEKLFSPLAAAMTIPAGVITVGGYFAADMIINKAYAVVNIPTNSIQAIASAAVFVIMAVSFDRVKLKSKIK